MVDTKRIHCHAAATPHHPFSRRFGFERAKLRNHFSIFNICYFGFFYSNESYPTNPRAMIIATGIKLLSAMPQHLMTYLSSKIRCIDKFRILGDTASEQPYSRAGARDDAVLPIGAEWLSRESRSVTRRKLKHLKCSLHSSHTLADVHY